MVGESEEDGAAIDRLYSMPLEEFTAARDELARQLRHAGAPTARDVKQLRKPSAAAWALNQVRRNNPERSDELLEAGRRLREGHERLLAGAGRELFERAAEDQRRLVVELGAHAERELVAAGRSVSGALQEKLRATLRAVASGVEARDGFALGRLVRDHEATGLGPLPDPADATRASGTRGAESSEAKPTAAERKAHRLEQRLQAARARQRELEEENATAARSLREARREAERVAREVERAKAAEQDTRGRAEEAAKATSKLERELHRLASTRAR